MIPFRNSKLKTTAFYWAYVLCAIHFRLATAKIYLELPDDNDFGGGKILSVTVCEAVNNKSKYCKTMTAIKLLKKL